MPVLHSSVCHLLYSMQGIDLDKTSYNSICMKPDAGHGVTWAKGQYDSIQARFSPDTTG